MKLVLQNGKLSLVLSLETLLEDVFGRMDVSCRSHALTALPPVRIG